MVWPCPIGHASSFSGTHTVWSGTRTREAEQCASVYWLVGARPRFFLCMWWALETTPSAGCAIFLVCPFKWGSFLAT